MNDALFAGLFASEERKDAASGAEGAPAAPRPGNTGILPSQSLEQMLRAKPKEIIGAPREIEANQIQPASIDLRLGRVAYRVRASFLPGQNATVAEKVKQFDGYPIDLSSPEGAILETNKVYVVQLQESLNLQGDIHGIANPKSSTGRLDILTRLITDRSSAFDQIQAGYKGPLYVEIAPQTFSVVVREGVRLNQVRFQRLSANLPSAQLRDLYTRGQLVRSEGLKESDLNVKEGLVPVTIDLKGGGLGSLIGYRAKKHTDRIDIEKIGHYDPREFWEPLTYEREPTLVLDPDAFYILVTREEVGVPPDYAAEMVPYYTRSGEYRVHYAGFFDPGFGWAEAAGGSRAVLEVRSHEVPFVLEHGQTVGWLQYERLVSRSNKLYGVGIKSNYQGQGLALAKQFRPISRDSWYTGPVPT